MLRKLLGVFILTLLAVPVVAQPSASTADQQTTENIRRALERLPYYGVFDFLAFRYDRGTVTLSGYAYAPGVKRDAVAAIKNIARVDNVVDQVVQLSVSPHDDRIRWSTFHKIYNDDFLSRYAPGGGLPVRFDRQFFTSRYPGMQPFGTYPIHIVVRNGKTLLVGVVDSESDKTVAGIRAREVPGSFGVDNELTVPQKGTR